MKKAFAIIMFSFLLALFSCKKERNKSMIVVKDCTGTYLRFGEKDYHICNLEKISSYADGTKVIATFKKIKECKGSANEVVVCNMLHKNEGWVEVLEIK
jgi:hypothetical protein